MITLDYLHLDFILNLHSYYILVYWKKHSKMASNHSTIDMEKYNEHN